RYEVLPLGAARSQCFPYRKSIKGEIDRRRSIEEEKGKRKKKKKKKRKRRKQKKYLAGEPSPPTGDFSPRAGRRNVSHVGRGIEATLPLHLIF
ncbi:hypothetical protein B296_00056153, partial [Ensete ventricosum]